MVDTRKRITLVKNRLYIIISVYEPGMVVHTCCNPSYSGGRDEEDLGLSPSWAKC
jgi:hypothetical protein